MKAGFDPTRSLQASPVGSTMARFGPLNDAIFMDGFDGLLDASPLTGC
jgi:hypothetical protein